MIIRQNADKYFLKGSPANKTMFGGHVIECITANSAQFPNLPYALPAMKLANNLLMTTAADAKSGDRTRIAARNSAEKAWNTIWRKTADYVSFLAAGNAIIIANAGFTPTSGQSTRKGKPDDAVLDTMTQQEGGMAKVTVKHPGAGRVAAYLYLALPDDMQTAMAADGTITITTAHGEELLLKCATHTTTTIGGLKGSKRMKMLVQPVNNKGAGGTSSPKGFTPQP